MPAELIQRYDTIGHQVLDLEAELGVSTEPHKETLDSLIEGARGKIQVKDMYTREDALGILTTIEGILRNNRFKQGGNAADLFHEGLGSKKIDCDDTSFIYLSIADALGLPLVAVSAPGHLFVRFILNDGSYINWETTSTTERGNDYYISWRNISPVAIDNGVYLRNLSRHEIIALAYNNRGSAWAGKGNLDEAIKDYNKAIRLNPNHAAAYNNRGFAWFNKGNLDEAIKDYNEAIRLDPNFARAYTNRGSAWSKKGNLDKAIEDYNEAIRLDPNYAAAYYNRGFAWFNKGNPAKAASDFRKYESLMRR